MPSGQLEQCQLASSALIAAGVSGSSSSRRSRSGAGSRSHQRTQQLGALDVGRGVGAPHRLPQELQHLPGPRLVDQQPPPQVVQHLVDRRAAGRAAAARRPAGPGPAGRSPRPPARPARRRSRGPARRARRRPAGPQPGPSTPPGRARPRPRRSGSAASWRRAPRARATRGPIAGLLAAALGVVPRIGLVRDELGELRPPRSRPRVHGDPRPVAAAVLVQRAPRRVGDDPERHRLLRRQRHQRRGAARAAARTASASATGSRLPRDLLGACGTRPAGRPAAPVRATARPARRARRAYSSRRPRRGTTSKQSRSRATNGTGCPVSRRAVHSTARSWPARKARRTGSSGQVRQLRRRADRIGGPGPPAAASGSRGHPPPHARDRRLPTSASPGTSRSSRNVRAR